MKILAVDTSTAMASAALLIDGKPAGVINIEDGKTHSEKLVPMIEEILSNAGLLPGDIDYFAASIGPGSFTGLRIGVTTVKVMAFASCTGDTVKQEKNCIAVPTLDALSYNCKDFNGIICPMIDARNDQVFTALYTGGDGGTKRISEYMAKPIGELTLDIKQACETENTDQIILVGDAATKHEAFFKANIEGLNCAAATEDKLLANAVSVGEIAWQYAKEGKSISHFDLVPNYFRKSSAEQAKEGRQI